ncbi:MAG: hypothetical protein PHZ00_06730 [Candidatus Peribacteraceae bacterium]|nr:hypothetical protein [Candidatus Peribacteraceae bacterium]
MNELAAAFVCRWRELNGCPDTGDLGALYRSNHMQRIACGLHLLFVRADWPSRLIVAPGASSEDVFNASAMQTGMRFLGHLSQHLLQGGAEISSTEKEEPKQRRVGKLQKRARRRIETQLPEVIG